YQMEFDLETGRGTIVMNVSHIPLKHARRAFSIMRKSLISRFCTSRKIAVLPPGTRFGNHIVPEKMLGIGTVCSVTINGMLHSQGIPVHSVFGGLLAVESYEPTRFIDLVHYGATSLDPLVIFIKGRATSVTQAVTKGAGIVGAGFREFPAVAREHVIQIVNRAAEWGIHGVLAIGGSSQPLTEVPVGLGRCGMVVCAGLNAIAALEEAQISTVSHAMETICRYEDLIDIDEAYVPEG
ncbi:MAG: NrpR regulatory domain-containing protein, partial [Candidatus Zipacnadales bacterium]